MKTLEYLAAGRPVVATPLPAVRSLESDLVSLAETPGDFASAVLRAAPLAQQPALVAKRRALAAEHSWAKRAEQLACLLDLECNEKPSGDNGGPPSREPGTTPTAGADIGMLGARARSGMVWSLLNSVAARVLNLVAGLSSRGLSLPRSSAPTRRPCL